MKTEKNIKNDEDVNMSDDIDEMKYSYELKIPKERVAVLIGKKGEIKNRIEKETESKIHVDSNDGDVKITGADSLELFSAREIIKAIGRGFSPDIAMQMLKGDHAMEILIISDYVGKSQKTARRLKARIIGTEGKTRSHIEEMTDTNISVYGKTIGIIGEAENVMMARRAIESILAGATHASVYKWLERKKRELERSRMLGTGIELKE